MALNNLFKNNIDDYHSNTYRVDERSEMSYVIN